MVGVSAPILLDGLDITNSDLQSSSSCRESSNMKSIGKRVIFRLTACIKTLVSLHNVPQFKIKHNFTAHDNVNLVFYNCQFHFLLFYEDIVLDNKLGFELSVVFLFKNCFFNFCISSPTFRSTTLA